MPAAIRAINDIVTEQGIKAEACDIDRHPLFDVPLATTMAFYADAHEDKETEEEEDAKADPDVEV
jgi:hypothetical protein